MVYGGAGRYVVPREFQLESSGINFPLYLQERILNEGKEAEEEGDARQGKYIWVDIDVRD